MSSEPAAPRPDAELAATFERPRRLHVAAAVSGAVVALRGIAFPLVVAVLVGGSGGGMGRALIFGALGVLFALGIGPAVQLAFSLLRQTPSAPTPVPA